MAFMVLVAFFGGLMFVFVKRAFAGYTCYFAPSLFLLGFLALALNGHWPGVLIGSVLIGFANGCGVPFIISAASLTAGKRAVSTVMPLISAALYLGQFVNPFIMSAVRAGFESIIPCHLPYWSGVFAAGLLFIWSTKLRQKRLQ